MHQLTHSKLGDDLEAWDQALNGEDLSLQDYLSISWSTAEAKGFHAIPYEIDRRLLLVITEIAEAIEQVREGHTLTDVYFNKEKPEKPEGFPIELADTVIRVFELAVHHDIDLEAAVRLKMRYNLTRPPLHDKCF